MPKEYPKEYPKKDVTIKGVETDDWELLIKIAEYHNITMAEMIHMFANQFATTQEEKNSIFDMIEDNRKRRKDTLKKILEKRPIISILFEDK